MRSATLDTSTPQDISLDETAARKARYAAAIKRADFVALWLDDKWRIPVIGRRFGLDSLMGLVPVAGDVVGALLSTYAIIEGIRLGLPREVVLKMVKNWLIEFLVGLIPILGDWFDVVWKANRRNFKLLRDTLEQMA